LIKNFPSVWEKMSENRRERIFLAHTVHLLADTDTSQYTVKPFKLLTHWFTSTSLHSYLLLPAAFSYHDRTLFGHKYCSLCTMWWRLPHHCGSNPNASQLETTTYQEDQVTSDSELLRMTETTGFRSCQQQGN